MLLPLIIALFTPYFCLCICKVMKAKSRIIGWSLMWVQGLAFLGFWMWTGNLATRKKREWWSSIQEAESETGPNLWLLEYTNGVNVILFSSPFSHSQCFKLIHKILLHVETMLCAPIQACSSVHTPSVLKLLPFLQVNYFPSKCRVFECVSSSSCKYVETILCFGWHCFTKWFANSITWVHLNITFYKIVHFLLVI